MVRVSLQSVERLSLCLGILVAETLTLEQSFGDVYGGGCPLQFLQTVGLTSHFGWHGRSLR